MTKTKNLGNPSGFIDTLPAEKLLLNKLMHELSTVVESYGFAPIDTPEIEWMNTLTGHDDSGGKLIYRVFNGYEIPQDLAELEQALDKGLRFDLTVPLARFYGQHAGKLPLPFKRYHWGKVFRGETAQTGKGRYREFYQFDADTIGSKAQLSEVETAALLIDAMKQLQLPAVVRLNNRKLLDGFVEVAGIADPEQRTALFTLIDKFDKIGSDKVIATAQEKFGEDVAQLLASYLVTTGSNIEKITALETLLGKSDIAREGLSQLSELFSLLETAGYGEYISFSPEIVRGLSYYTGVIFETVITGFEQYGSVASGGRYDRLIEDLGGPSQPAVGVSFGVSRLMDVLKQQGWNSTKQTPAQVFIAYFDTELMSEYFALATHLRSCGIATQLYSEAKKVGSQLQYASDLGIAYALIVGQEEYEKKVILIRNLQTRKQIEVKKDDVVEKLRELLQEE